MNKSWTNPQTSVYLIHYHFVFCPRYRRKIFLISGVENRCLELIYEKCNEAGIEVLNAECGVDYVHIFLSCPPSLSPAEIAHQLKSYTGHILINEFKQLSRMRNLWTRNYFVSTSDMLCEAEILQYVETQRKRY